MVATLAASLVFVLMVGCSARQEPPAAARITADEAWARPARAGENSAIYLVLRNGGSEADALVGARAPVAEVAELHRSQMRDGVMRMEHVAELAVPAGETVTLEPGGYHIMLMQLTQDLAPGDRFSVTLAFTQAGEIEVPVVVREP